MSEKPNSPLRRRMIEDMTIRGINEKTQLDCIRHVKNFTIFLGRSPDTATPEDLRAYQLHEREQGVQPPTISATVSLWWKSGDRGYAANAKSGSCQGLS